MILGIGIDMVDIVRFANWHTYSHTTLRRIFSLDEIEYCTSLTSQSAQRFAVRFAAREALYKALCQAVPDYKIPFLTLCKHTEIKKDMHGAPYVVVNWGALQMQHSVHVLLSMTHTCSTAAAYVVVQR